MKKITLCCIPLAIAALSACQPQPSSVAPPAKSDNTAEAATFKPVAGVQDLMAYEVDPSADALWGAVSVVIDKRGITENQPTTDKEWDEMRGRALILIEAANLLSIDHRVVARKGFQKLDDDGLPGNYSAAQAQQAIDSNRQAFNSFARELGLVGEQMLKAIDSKSPHDLMDAGGALDEACESCHLKFWYPGEQAVKAAAAANSAAKQGV